jgi:hypothetical protein
MLIILILCSIGISIFCTYLYRQGVMGDYAFTGLLGMVGGISVYTAMVALGISHNRWGPLSIFAIAGLLIGFQGARVIIRIGNMEKR